MTVGYTLPPLVNHTSLVTSPAICTFTRRHCYVGRKPIAQVRSFHSTTARMSVSEGAAAPDFTKTDGDGKEVTLSSFRGSRNVVLYFSNGAGPGCTSQSCSFRDAAEDFAQLDAEIIAVSAQRDTTAFKRDNSLPFSVVPDPKGELQKLYGVPATLGLLPGRVTFVIDKQGIVASVYNSQFSTAAHIKTAGDALKSLGK